MKPRLTERKVIVSLWLNLSRPFVYFRRTSSITKGRDQFADGLRPTIYVGLMPSVNCLLIEIGH